VRIKQRSEITENSENTRNMAGALRATGFFHIRSRTPGARTRPLIGFPGGMSVLCRFGRKKDSPRLCCCDTTLDTDIVAGKSMKSRFRRTV
jgi:hypothetical protein